DAQLGLEPLPQRGGQLARRVADDGDARRLDAERQELAGDERAVEIRALAADELAPRDDDRSPRPRSGGGAHLAAGCRRDLPRRGDDRSRAAGVQREGPGAVQAEKHVRGGADREREPRCDERLRLAALQGAVEEQPPEPAARGLGVDVDERAPGGGPYDEVGKPLPRRVDARDAGRRFLRGPGSGAAELPGRDHERRHAGDRHQGEHDHVQLDAAVLAAADTHLAWRPRVAVLVHPEARAVLVDVQLAVEAEEVRVAAQEAPDIGLPGEHVEVLLLERLQVADADLRRLRGGRQVEALAPPRLLEAGADLEHPQPILRQTLADVPSRLRMARTQCANTLSRP